MSAYQIQTFPQQRSGNGAFHSHGNYQQERQAPQPNHTTYNHNGTLEVYSPGFRGLLVVPSRDVLHTPPSHLNVTRLVLCANFDAADPVNSCKMGNRCKFVHADVARATHHEVHVNYAWRSVEDVTYERFSGEALEVAPPNGTVANVTIPAAYVLKTNALNSTRRPLSHCAHYYYNRACNRGPSCNFIHAVYIDPTARDHQRAPVPSQIHPDHNAGHVPVDPATRRAQRQHHRLMQQLRAAETMSSCGASSVAGKSECTRVCTCIDEKGASCICCCVSNDARSESSSSCGDHHHRRTSTSTKALKTVVGLQTSRSSGFHSMDDVVPSEDNSSHHEDSDVYPTCEEAMTNSSQAITPRENHSMASSTEGVCYRYNPYSYTNPTVAC